MGERKRDQSLALKFSSEEITLIKNKATEVGMTLTDFVVDCVDNKPIIVVPDIVPMLVELRKHGEQLKEAIKHMNSSSGPNFHYVESTIRRCNELYSNTLELFEKVRERVG